MCDVRVITDESPVEIGESKEGTNILYLSQGWPVSNSIEFSGIHFDVSGG